MVQAYFFSRQKSLILRRGQLLQLTTLRESINNAWSWPTLSQNLTFQKFCSYSWLLFLLQRIATISLPLPNTWYHKSVLTSIMILAHVWYDVWCEHNISIFREKWQFTLLLFLWYQKPTGFLLCYWKPTDFLLHYRKSTGFLLRYLKPTDFLQCYWRPLGFLLCSGCRRVPYYVCEPLGHQLCVRMG